MKKCILEFLRRGLIACGFGPVVLAILFLILQNKTGIESLTVNEVCLGIFSLSALAFIAGGMNVIYQIERLSLMVAILIHGGVLYISYLAAYLINGWLEWGWDPILVFSAIFVLGYLLIWATIYLIITKNTKKINKILKEKQQLRP
ncbi:MAG: DUF3021 domain-containing protein [Ruminococcaceae bacterium]|nr:DUF3021 domain-containing protein [Oscillospiraceae bacterium]